MNIELACLEPNPWRNFSMFPVEPDRVQAIERSIRDHGFWGGIACRQTDDGRFQIGAGHVRVQAAIAADVHVADVQIFPWMDAQMVRIDAVQAFATRTCKSEMPHCIFSVVFNSIKFIVSNTSSDERLSKQDRKTFMASLESARGPSARIICRFLGVPQITDRMVRDAIKCLQGSGELNQAL